jgi:hypothetical protein
MGDDCTVVNVSKGYKGKVEYRESPANINRGVAEKGIQGETRQSSAQINQVSGFKIWQCLIEAQKVI